MTTRNSVLVELRLVSLPTLEALAAGHDRAPDDDRRLVIIRIEDGDGAVGWGECSALNRPTYTREWAEGAYGVLAGLSAGGDPPTVAGQPMAAAGLEMAFTDLHLRVAGLGLGGSLGVSRRTIPAGAAVGLAPLPQLVERVDALVSDGFGRIKLKIEPGHDVQPVTLLRRCHPDLELQVDGNGSYPSSSAPALSALARLGVTVFEQPFAVDDMAGPRSLIDAGLTVVADEAVGCLADADRLAAEGALTAISLKPARVGGLRAARAIHDWALEAGIGLTAGGMLESGLGRHALAVFAALDGFTITGDLSPARRWLAEDPWPDLTLLRPTAGPAHVAVPDCVGVAPDPDLDTLDRHTVEQCRFRWETVLGSIGRFSRNRPG